MLHVSIPKRTADNSKTRFTAHNNFYNLLRRTLLSSNSFSFKDLYNRSLIYNTRNIFFVRGFYPIVVLG